MLLASAPLFPTSTALRSGQLELLAYINEVCDHIDAVEPLIQALLPEPDRRTRLLGDAEALQKRFPRPKDRPPLYGILIGVKDIINVEGFPTHAGSQLPPKLFAGPEASCVTALRDAGALIMGKTISAEFAWMEPGPTRNPHNPGHTPGGSSSGSAAAIAAGYCQLALGTQTIGSVIRPAAFCGIVGFKPSFGRIASMGVVPCAPSLDTVGFFTQDVAGVALTAPLFCQAWQSFEPGVLPILGLPDRKYLAQASPETLDAFEKQLSQLEKVGYTIRNVPALVDIEAIHRRHMLIVFAEMALVHAEWFAQYESLYRPRTVTAIREGQRVDIDELTKAREGRLTLRVELEELMARHGIDLWISPAAAGPAPAGITTTGNPTMNLPWTYAGLPVITLPAGQSRSGLPLGLQLIGAMMTDERLVAWARKLKDSI